MSEKNNTDKKQNNESGLVGIKEVSLTPVITSLFKPSADMLGIELKDYLKEKIGTWKKKKYTYNLAQHIKRANEKIKEKHGYSVDSSNFEQLELFDQWILGAQEVDPHEKLLANIWQELLVEIAAGRKINKILLEKLKKVSPGEAEILLEIHQNDSIRAKSKEQKFLLSSLMNNGVIEKTFFYFWQKR